MIKLTIQTLPVSTNHLYIFFRGHRTLSKRGRENKEAIGWEVRSQYHGKPLQAPLGVEIQLYWPTRRNHDIDNIKGLLDSCTGILWKDDGQIVELHLTKHYDKGNGRVEMQVTEYV